MDIACPQYRLQPSSVAWSYKYHCRCLRNRWDIHRSSSWLAANLSPRTQLVVCTVPARYTGYDTHCQSKPTAMDSRRLLCIQVELPVCRPHMDCPPFQGDNGTERNGFVLCTRLVTNTGVRTHTDWYTARWCMIGHWDSRCCCDNQSPGTCRMGYPDNHSCTDTQGDWQPWNTRHSGHMDLLLCTDLNSVRWCRPCRIHIRNFSYIPLKIKISLWLMKRWIMLQSKSQGFFSIPVVGYLCLIVWSLNCNGFVGRKAIYYDI